ncbi:MAG: DUF4260 family protein [Saccharothrix sp.]|nr:DUF4260 family protein [Saccharothrix sp.]
MSVVHAPARRVAKRVAWAALAVFLLAFIVLEVVNHGGPALVAALLFLIAPDLTMVIGASTSTGKGKQSPKAVPYYNFMHRPWIPLAVLVVYSAGGLGDWVPLFTAALGWLAHIAADRAFGYGLRARDGSRRV